MASLTPSDVKHWDADAIHQVFQTASNRAQTLQRLGDNLQQVLNGLSDWHGEAGEAFHADMGQTRRDIEADGQESRHVAAAVSAAEADVRACKAELDGIEHAAQGFGWTITPDWRIDVGAMSAPERVMFAAQEDLLQGQLNTCKEHAHNADHELATAVRASVGQAPVGAAPGSAPAPPGAPQPKAGQPPKSPHDMLLSTGAANEGDAAKGPPVPAGAGSGKPPSWEDMMLVQRHARPRTAAAGQPAGSFESAAKTRCARWCATAEDGPQLAGDAKLPGDGSQRDDRERHAAGSGRGETERDVGQQSTVAG